MQHKLSHRTLDISCFEDLCEPCELISGVEYRYNVDGELEFLGLAESDREAIDTEFYHCIGGEKVAKRIEQIRVNKPHVKQAFERAKGRARVAKEAANEAAKLKAAQEKTALKHMERLVSIMGRKPTLFEESFYQPIETTAGWLLMFELRAKHENGFEEKFVNYAHGRSGLPILNNQFDMVAALMRTVLVTVVYCNIMTKESFVEEYSFADRASVEALLKPTNLAPTSWGALLVDDATLCKLALLKEEEVQTRNFTYVHPDKGLWNASAHFTRRDNYVKRVVEFALVRNDGPKLLR